MNKKNNLLTDIIPAFDWVLLAVTILTAVFGIISIYSATRSMETMSNVYVQLASFFIGLIIMLALAFFDYEQIAVLVPYIYGLGVISLILVLIPGIGYAGSWGARSWIRFNSAIGFQPAEIVKVFFVVTFAWHLEKTEEKINKPLWLLGLVAHVLILIGLIMCQPDAGSSMVFAFIFMCMIFTAGLSYKYILPVLGAGIVSAPLVFFFVLNKFQRTRILVFLNPESQPLEGGYNVIQSKIAVGSGRLFGKGFLQGTQNQMKLLPTKHTDFIYSVISEEWGFIGSVFIILLLYFIIYRCFNTAKHSDTLFGKYICTGIGAMFLFHTLENIGMCIGLTPVTGIPLPFVSYGGTSLITNMIAIGLVLSVYYHSNNSMFKN